MDSTSENSPHLPGDQIPPIVSALGCAHALTPRSLLHHLCTVGVLGLTERCESHITREGLFLDIARLHARSLARIAYRALVDPLPKDLGTWIDMQVEQAALELVTEDMLLGADPIPTSAQDPIVRLAECLGISARTSQRACGHLNILPLEMRRICRRIFLEATSVEVCARDIGVSSSELRDRIEAIVLSIHRLAADEAAESA